jgi:hypothetical protein
MILCLQHLIYNNMKQTNYFKSINFMKSFLLTGLLILISTFSFAQGVYDANFAALNFSSESGRQFRITDATAANSLVANCQVLYKNVITINGQQIDCRVTNSRTITVFDSTLNRSNTFRQQKDNMFLPTVSANNETIFTFEFGISTTGTQRSNGSFPLTSFTPIIIKNIFLNFYDIDRHTNSDDRNDRVRIYSSNYTEYSLYGGTGTTVEDDFRVETNIISNHLRFTHNNTTTNNVNNYTNLTNSNFRARVKFNAISNLRIGLEPRESSSSTTAFYLDFSAGPNATETVVDNPSTNVLSIDLNTSSSSTEDRYLVNGSNSFSYFTGSTSSSNFTSTRSNFIDFTIYISTSNIQNSNQEFIVVRPSTTVLTNGSIRLDQDRTSASQTQFVLGTTNYRWESSSFNNNTIRRITIRKVQSASTPTVVPMSSAETEALLDALAYNHTGTGGSYTTGVRLFSIQTTLDSDPNDPDVEDIQSPSVFFIADMGGILPVNLISFTGLSKKEGNQLNWTVAQEVDFSHYEVLRSTNGKDFAKIGEVYPENKSTEMKNYTFLDASVKADLAYYKLNLINEDGSSSFSNLVVINRTVVAPVVTKLYPNPASTTLLVSLEGVDAEVSTITIHDLSGKVVYSTETSDVATLLDINELNKGMYIVKVASQSGFVSVSRFIKN